MDHGKEKHTVIQWKGRQTTTALSFKGKPGSFWITSTLSNLDSDNHKPVQLKTSAAQGLAALPREPSVRHSRARALAMLMASGDFNSKRHRACSQRNIKLSCKSMGQRWSKCQKWLNPYESKLNSETPKERKLMVTNKRSLALFKELI